MNHRRLNTPWETRTNLYSAPGSLILKLALGEAPETVPSAADVRACACHPATHTRVASVDRILSHFSNRVQVARVHTAAASLSRIGQRHTAFDDLEHILGLSRTFRIEADQNCCVEDLVDALRQVAVVEQASAHYLCALPFEAALPRPSAADPTRESAGRDSREQIRAREAIAYDEGSPFVVVAVVDTGVAQDHGELSGRLRRGLDTVQLVSAHMAPGIELVGDVTGVDIHPEDNVGHGTACAAIIAAQGMDMPPGLGGNCRVLPIRVLAGARFPGNDKLSGIGAIADIDHGVKTAMDLGAKVLNLSFGTPEAALDSNDPVPHSDVVRYGHARQCIMVAATGNSGLAERYAPASLDGVIAVGAVGKDDRPAPFSTGGDHVDIAAPGVRVLSAGLEDYQLVTGTSFAAPFVAATAGLLVSRAARRAHPLDGVSVRRILRASADPWPAGVGEGHGVGTLNAYGALQALDREIDHGGPTTS